MRVTLITGIVLSAFCGDASSRHVFAPGCAMDCSRDLMDVHGLSEMDSLCNDIALQRALFLCLANSCHTTTYGPALAYSISRCTSLGAPIGNLHPVQLQQSQLAQQKPLSLFSRSMIEPRGSTDELSLAMDCTAGLDGVLTLSLPPVSTSSSGVSAPQGGSSGARFPNDNSGLNTGSNSPLSAASPPAAPLSPLQGQPNGSPNQQAQGSVEGPVLQGIGSGSLNPADEDCDPAATDPLNPSSGGQPHTPQLSLSPNSPGVTSPAGYGSSQPISSTQSQTSLNPGDGLGPSNGNLHNSGENSATGANIPELPQSDGSGNDGLYPVGTGQSLADEDCDDAPSNGPNSGSQNSPMMPSLPGDNVPACPDGDPDDCYHLGQEASPPSPPSNPTSASLGDPAANGGCPNAGEGLSDCAAPVGPAPQIPGPSPQQAPIGAVCPGHPSCPDSNSPAAGTAPPSQALPSPGADNERPASLGPPPNGQPPAGNGNTGACLGPNFGPGCSPMVPAASLSPQSPSPPASPLSSPLPPGLNEEGTCSGVTSDGVCSIGPGASSSLPGHQAPLPPQSPSPPQSPQEPQSSGSRTIPGSPGCPYGPDLGDCPWDGPPQSAQTVPQPPSTDSQSPPAVLPGPDGISAPAANGLPSTSQPPESLPFGQPSYGGAGGSSGLNSASTEPFPPSNGAHVAPGPQTCNGDCPMADDEGNQHSISNPSNGSPGVLGVNGIPVAQANSGGRGVASESGVDDCDTDNSKRSIPSSESGEVLSVDPRLDEILIIKLESTSVNALMAAARTKNKRFWEIGLTGDAAVEDSERKTRGSRLQRDETKLLHNHISSDIVDDAKSAGATETNEGSRSDDQSSNVSSPEHSATTGGSSRRSQPCTFIFVLVFLVFIGAFDDLWRM